MLNNFHQQQQQQQQQQQLQAASCPPPGMHGSPRVAGYQQYGSGNIPGQEGERDGMVSYPTAHLYQNHQASRVSAPPAAPPTPPGISDPVTKAVVDNILGKLPTKKNQVTYHCEVCEQEFSGRSVLDTHLSGSKHAKKLKSMEILQQLAASGQNFSHSGPGGNLRCEACGVDANSSQQLQTHLAGNKHKQRMLKLGGKMPPPPTPPTSLCSLMPPPPAPSSAPSQAPPPVPAPGTESVESQRFICEVCNVTLNSTAQMLQHMESRKHKEREQPQPKQHSSKHHPYRRQPQIRFSQPSARSSKKKKQPLAFLTPLSSSFVPGSML